MAIFERKIRNVLRSDQLSDFCRHVGAMCSVGVPLTTAMGILKLGTEDRNVKQLYGELQDLMEQGRSFSDALKHTNVFPKMLINMFKAAEASGHLEETAKQLAIHYRKEHRIKSQIRTATLYPKILCLVSLFVILTVLIVVVPTVEPLFRGVELPVLTRILLVLSSLVKERWYLCIGSLLGIYLVGRTILKQEKMRVLCDRVKINLPLIGKQSRIIFTARFARSESRLYSSGLPMVESLEIAARTVGNKYLETQFTDVIRMVQGGTSFSAAIETVDGFDKKLAPVIFVGEETGKLDEMLEELAESYEYDAEMAINRLVAMVEPMMIVLMGIVIGMILLGIMMPMWSMYEYIV